MTPKYCIHINYLSNRYTELEVGVEMKGLRSNYRTPSFGVRRLVYEADRPYRSGVGFCEVIGFGKSPGTF